MTILLANPRVADSLIDARSMPNRFVLTMSISVSVSLTAQKRKNFIIKPAIFQQRAVRTGDICAHKLAIQWARSCRRVPFYVIHSSEPVTWSPSDTFAPRSHRLYRIENEDPCAHRYFTPIPPFKYVAWKSVVRMESEVTRLGGNILLNTHLISSDNHLNTSAQENFPPAGGAGSVAFQPGTRKP